MFAGTAVCCGGLAESVRAHCAREALVKNEIRATARQSWGSKLFAEPTTVLERRQVVAVALSLSLSLSLSLARALLQTKMPLW